MSEEKLRNCPFCGGEAEAIRVYANEWYVQCTICPCTMIGGYYTEKEAIEAWNRRYKEQDNENTD